MRKVLAGVILVGLLAGPAAAAEIGFLEQFSLAKDRSVPLKELIPGTPDYYYYHCLHHQNSGRPDEVEKLLPLWIKRHGEGGRVPEIRNRQALLLYDRDPQKALQFIKDRLGLRFAHSKELLGQKPNYPTRLDQTVISWKTLSAEARARHRKLNLGGFEDSAFDRLAGTDLSGDERRDLLRRLKRPDYPNLPDRVVKDLKHKYRASFGAYLVHRQMLRSQLDECLGLMPELLTKTAFVNIYVAKLRPNAEDDWQHNTAARKAYLERLWSFVNRLAPAHNSLKAHVLYHRLLYDRSQNVYDKDRFLTYVKLPRRTNYVAPEYLRREEHRRVLANLAADYRKVTLLPPVRNDEPLVRSYLQHFFIEEDGYKPYETYIRDTYLKNVFAETKIVNGIGDMERWYKMLSPSEYQVLKERIDLDFAPTNQTVFGADEAVSLDLHVKNVKTLIVKVYQINTFNYYREHAREVGTEINLDGLVANQELVRTYDVVALRRVRRRFHFPALRQRGVYVIEFIGNGKSSRALVRKGQLRHIERITPAGHTFTVLDESNRKLNDAELWLAGHRYAPDKDGTITLPFTNRPGRQSIILRRGTFSSLAQFEHRSEQYHLVAGIHVEREALLKGEKATVIVRPMLYLNGMPVSLSLLEDVELTIQSVDRSGVSTTKPVKDFKLHEDQESAYEFKVPENLSSISFVLRAKVKSLSQNKKIDLAPGQTFRLNGIDRTDRIDDLHLCHVGGEYVLELLGKTGEAKADRPVSVEVKHRDFRRRVHASLQTDKNASVALGGLKDILWLRASAPGGASHTWVLPRDGRSYPASVHGRVGEPLSVPYLGARREADADAFSLLEQRGTTYLKDRRDALALRGGFLEIKGLPAGNYSLLLKESNTHINVRLTGGDRRDGYVLSKSRLLETRNRRPLHIVRVDTAKDTVTVRLANSSKFARVHVFGTRFMPEYPADANLGCVSFPEPDEIWVDTRESIFLSGRNIGDEYRYIIERKYAKRFPGNMLKRPGLLLNPWAIRKTDAGRQHARRGREWGRTADRARKRTARRYGRPPMKHPPRVAGSWNLDFLARPAVVMANLRPDKDGVVTIQRKDLGPHQQIRVVAVDPENTVWREVALPVLETKFRDLRLIAALDSKKHFTEQKQISPVRAGGRLALADIATSTIEVYDSLPKVYRLYLTLSGDGTLPKFAFILNWPKLKPEEKQAKYSEYACHELHFFLYKRDPDFFTKVVLPYLKNKKDKTFMDHWLIGADLSPYLKPWAFGRLNVVERILLAQRIKAEGKPMARHVRELWELIPPNMERDNHLFRTALKGSALETEEGPMLGLGEAKRELRDEEARKAGKELEKLARARPTRAAAAKPKAPAPATRRPAEDAEMAMGNGGAGGAYYRADKKKREALRQYYRKLDKTREWAENNYYHLPIERQNAGLITVNSFWRDYAAYDGKAPFLSSKLAEASRSFPEMMLALAVLDLPFEAKKHKTIIDGAQFTLDPAGPVVVYHKEIKVAADAAEKTPILVSQNFFKHNDRYKHVNNERVDKYVTDEFVVHTVYGCQVVVTNPTSSRQKLDVLLQVPRGAMPVSNGFYTRSIHLNLNPYSTRTFDYYFYFPAAGDQPHYPVHVAKHEKLIGFAKPVTLKVVKKLSKIDKTSWDYVSQHASNDEVEAYLKQNNIRRVKLSRIAFRMRDKAYFRKIIALLGARHVYDHTLWSYGIRHDELGAAREYLQHSPFAGRCGAYIDCKLLTIDPVIRRTYQHLEYLPLVNARAHKLGKRRRIVNARLYAQYLRLMKVLSYRPKLDDTDRMATTYYLLLQDRVDEALGFFTRVDPAKLATRIQHDYFRAYVDFFTDDHKVARAVAAKYKTHPVDRWRKRFLDVLAQLDEIEGKGPKVADDKDRAQVQGKLAATEASLDFKVESRKVTVHYQNLKTCTVNYYLMDIELLFSRNPFVQRHSGQFAYIRPNQTQQVALPAGKKTLTFDLPARFHNSNVMVEIIAGAVKKSQPYFSHSLALQVIENYGQVKVSGAKAGKPLPKVYVKVYARMKGGRVQFYKDGYTDLRGRFDYTSLNTNELDNVDRFSLLIMSDTAGAVIREAGPPKR